MNREDRNGERYSHCLCLHVKPASLFIGIYFFVTSVLKLIKLSSGYNIRTEDDMRRFVAVNRPTTTLLFMINLMIAIVAAILIYGVTKSKASYLMPFFGIQLYHFLFSLPSSLSQLSSHVTPSQFRGHYGSTNPVPSPSEVRNLLRTEDNATFTLSVIATLIDFLCDIYFICVIWKCYRFLKIKEITSTLNLPYNLDLEIVVPSEVVSTTNITPPDYETATKDCPPPDYESAIKFQSYNVSTDLGNVNNSSYSDAPNQSNNENGGVHITTLLDPQKVNSQLNQLSSHNNNNINLVTNDQISDQQHHQPQHPSLHQSQTLAENPDTSGNIKQSTHQQRQQQQPDQQLSQPPPSTTAPPPSSQPQTHYQYHHQHQRQQPNQHQTQPVPSSEIKY